MNQAGLVCSMFALAWCSGVSLAQSGALDGLTVVRDARSRRVASNSPDPGSNADNRWVKPGDTLTLADIKGPGVIRHMWVTFAESGPSWLSKQGAADPSEIVLRMYWDGASAPAVEAPFGDFFGAGFGKRAEINSLPVVVQGGDAYNCYWAMPFKSSARITITNESEKPLGALYYQIDYTEERVPDDAAYFCAQYRQEFPTVKGHDYLISDIEAPNGGHYVGTVMSVRSRSPQWFGEGDEKFYIDGENVPSMWGTGTEDYFSNAWGMEKGCYPYFGVTMLDGWLGDLGEKGTMYRWHIADAVRFRKSLRLEIEHAGWMSADETTTGEVEGFVEREDDFATVAFWYQRGQPKRFATLPSAKSRKLPSIDRVFEGTQLLPQAESKGGGLSVQAGTPWTGAGQLFFDNDKGKGAWVEVAFDVDKPQTRRVVVPVTHSYDFGTYTIWFDGKKLGDAEDFYNPKIDVREHSLGDCELAAGTHRVRFECTGRNASSTGWKLGIDSVRLRERWNVKRPPIKPRDRKAGEMANFVFVRLKTGPKSAEKSAEERKTIFEGHMANIQRLAKAKQLIMAGPYDHPHDKTWRGVFVFDVATVEEARRLVETDPGVKAGVFTPELHLMRAGAWLRRNLEIDDEITKAQATQPKTDKPPAVMRVYVMIASGDAARTEAALGKSSLAGKILWKGHFANAAAGRPGGGVFVLDAKNADDIRAQLGPECAEGCSVDGWFSTTAIEKLPSAR